MTYIIYLITGILAGILSGLLGVGGGFVVVPILILFFQSMHIFPSPIIMHMAVGTSLSIMIFTSASSARAYYKHGLVVWEMFLKFLPGLVAGIIIGAAISQKTSNKTLIILFAVFLIIVAVHLFFSKNNLEDPLQNIAIKYPNALILSGAAICVGLLSSIFGIGGGMLMVPFFIFIGLDMRKASGTSSMCGVPIALIGTVFLTAMGWNATNALNSPFGTIGYIYWPATFIVSITSIIFASIGVQLSLLFKQRTLKVFLAVLLIFSSINLLMS